jgi:hypothetical protein
MQNMRMSGVVLVGLSWCVALTVACGSSGEGPPQGTDSTGSGGTIQPTGGTSSAGSNTGESNTGGSDGTTTGGGTQGTDPSPSSAPSAFRFDTAALVDPHVFLTNTDGTKTDLTSLANQVFAELNTKDQFNGQAQQGTDGNLDLSILGIFRPLDTQAESVPAELTVANCKAPLPTTGCTPANQNLAFSAKVTNKNGNCFQPYAGTTGGYSPAPNNPGGRCFTSATADITLPLLAGISIPFKQGTVAASYDSAQPTKLSNGVISAFLTEEQAQNIKFPTTIPLLGGQPISVLFKAEDMDQLSSGQKGWWLYFNFTAVLVPFSS